LSILHLCTDRHLSDTFRTFKETNAAPEKQQIVTPILAKTPPPTVYRSNRDKRKDVEAALRANPSESDRAIAAMTGTTHPFVAKTRRRLESVTT
jgi:hypothetical protein